MAHQHNTGNQLAKASIVYLSIMLRNCWLLEWFFTGMHFTVANQQCQNSAVNS